MPNQKNTIAKLRRRTKLEYLSDWNILATLDNTDSIVYTINIATEDRVSLAALKVTPRGNPYFFIIIKRLYPPQEDIGPSVKT